MLTAEEQQFLDTEWRPRSGSPLLLALALVAAIAFWPAAVWLIATLRTPVWEKWAAKNREVVSRWLESQRSGDSGHEFWRDAEPVSLYAVTGWEILRAESGSITVRVDSSNAAGMPVRKLWRIDVAGDRTQSIQHYRPLITRIEEAQ